MSATRDARRSTSTMLDGSPARAKGGYVNRSILTVSLALASIGSVTPSSGGQRAIANKAIVRGYLTEVLNGKQWELWDRCFSSSVTFNGSAISREWIVAMSNALHSAFPDLRVSIEEQIAEADLVATRVTFRGTTWGNTAESLPRDGASSTRESPSIASRTARSSRCGIRPTHPGCSTRSERRSRDSSRAMSCVSQLRKSAGRALSQGKQDVVEPRAWPRAAVPRL